LVPEKIRVRIVTPFCMTGSLSESHQSPRVPWVDQFRVYRFPLAVGVVITHIGIWMLNHQDLFPLSAQDNPIAWWVLRFLSYGVFRISTAAFLFIAGFLFFRNGLHTLGAYRSKLRSRINTLAVPYLIWNLIFLGAMILQERLLGGGKEEINMAFALKGLTGWPLYPADTPLWFVRDILILLVLSPVIGLVLNHFALPSLMVLFVHWVHPLGEIVPGGIPPQGVSMFFFCMGAVVGLKGIKCERLPVPKHIFWTSLALVVGFAATRTSLELAGRLPWSYNSLTDATRMAGVLLIVSGAVAMIPRGFAADALITLSDSSFFLFASHQLYLSGICKLVLPVGVRFIHLNPLAAFLLLLLTTVSLSSLTWFVLKRFFPAILSLLDGGRSLRSVSRKTLI
jgi:hypothetical protein